MKHSLSGVDLVMYDYLDSGEYKIESLSGSELFSTNIKHNFSAMKDAFLDGQFNFEMIKEISIQQREYIYSPKNNLQKFQYRAKMDSPRIKKYREISIEAKT